jgi:hypothetical protein
MTEEFPQRRALLRILEVKDSDIRILNLEQCRDAVDKGLHAGGAFSAVVPLVALYYGGFLDLDIADPTRRGQDMFTLSKGHAVATLASIYAELGYIDRKTLCGSRSYESILNGHPGLFSRVSKSQRVLWGRDCRSRKDSRLRGKRVPDSILIAWWAMGNYKKVPSGKALCMRALRAWTISAYWWIEIMASLIFRVTWCFRCPIWNRYSNLLDGRRIVWTRRNTRVSMPLWSSSNTPPATGSLLRSYATAPKDTALFRIF